MWKPEIAPDYGSHVPDTQCGPVARRGTGSDALILPSAIAYARIHELSIFLLYVDLVKAFDTPDAACDPMAYFTNIAVPHVSAEERVP